MIARRFLSASLVAGVLAVTVPAFVAPVGAAERKNQAAKKTSQKPKGATAQCEDGSYSTAKTQRGACSGHGGVKTWYSDSAASIPATPASEASLSKSKATHAPTDSATASAAPKGATAQCKDGSYSRAQGRRGACAGHGGVGTWFADADAGTKAAPKAPTEKPKSVQQTNTKVDTEAPGKSAAAGAPPNNATAKCKDGTYSYAKTHRGACSHHGGVAEWYK